MEGEIVEKIGEIVSGCNNNEHESVVHCNLPELESLIDQPLDYARVVRKMGNEIDATLVDFDGLLPSTMIMVVCVAASSSGGKPLTKDVLQETIQACDAALVLDSAKNKLVDFLESRMVRIAPNLSAVVGSAVAAKLMATAGGLSALAQTPADYIQFFGSKESKLARGGFSQCRAFGFVEEALIIERTPPPLRRRAIRLVAARLILAARMDFVGGDRSGETGMSFRVEMDKKIEKWQEAPPAKRAKPLPVPDCRPKKKRESKERYGLTEMRKLANRMQFGVAEESSLGGGYGMIGKLRVVAKKFKQGNGSSAVSNNLNLAFTAPQGLRLANPHADDPTTQTSYF